MRENIYQMFTNFLSAKSLVFRILKKKNILKQQQKIKDKTIKNGQSTWISYFYKKDI